MHSLHRPCESIVPAVLHSRPAGGTAAVSSTQLIGTVQRTERLRRFSEFAKNEKNLLSSGFTGIARPAALFAQAELVAMPV